jgi:hypothetical protein
VLDVHGREFGTTNKSPDAHDHSHQVASPHFVTRSIRSPVCECRPANRSLSGVLSGDRIVHRARDLGNAREDETLAKMMPCVFEVELGPAC